ncbi:MAG TPA: sulfotransferase, partial [Steroidobacteraceae bacterium]|nr:sulfotransferase [Steroidobacteraceae bacterium]
RLRALLERSEFGAALAAAQALLGEVPENRDVWYVVAVSQRYLQRIADALATLERLERLHPDYSRLFQERGHCHVALKQAEPAIEAFLRAVSLNPALPASWNALRILLRMTGREADAARAAEHVAKLASLPAEVVTATSMFSDGEIFAAERIIRDYLLEHGNHVEAMRLLAKIGMKLEVYDDAELLLEQALLLAPGYDAMRYDYVLTLLARHKHVQALEQIERLLGVDPNNRAYRITHATCCAGVGKHEQAVECYREVLRETPAAADLHLSIAHALKTLGRQQEAVASYRAAFATRPSYGDAYWSLANLKTYRFPAEDIEHMRAQERAPDLRTEDRYHLCFALGKALEDAGEYAESFRYYERGNALKKAELRFKIEPMERNARLQAAVCTQEFFAARRGFGCAAGDPIFIVGLPRAGSTLLEQILASHSDVEGTMELPNILRFVGELQGRDPDTSEPRYPAILERLSAKDLRELGEKYIADTRIYRSGKPRFIDKMPNNFRHIGLIHLILPNARIIDARREPMACCFSNFKQLFASGQEFTYSIEDIARYYRSYVQLMGHWDAALPGKVLRVQYENVVEDLEGNVRRILEFCGLPFEQACVEFYKTERSVRTASSEQVRQPIFKDGVDQWRKFEPWLGPLQSALGGSSAAAPPAQARTM